jgi:hypothetical protein
LPFFIELFTLSSKNLKVLEQCIRLKKQENNKALQKNIENVLSIDQSLNKTFNRHNFRSSIEQFQTKALEFL